jgi:hypothetical protein
MDHIDDVLENFTRDTKYHIAIRSAVDLARQTLNRYYSLTDASEVYRIAMGKCKCYNLLKYVTD